MEKSLVPAKTFVLKTNIQCNGCEKKMKKLLQNIHGVHQILIDAEKGKITISGTIDPDTILKLLEKNGKKSELLWEPVYGEDHKKLEIVPKPESPMNYHGIHNKDVLIQLQKISEIKGLKSLELTREKIRLTFNGQEGGDAHFHDFRGRSHETCCARNVECSIHTHCCNGCRHPPPPPLSPCRCNREVNSPAGLQWPGSTPSAPPEVGTRYYETPPPPPAPAPPPVMAYPYYSTFSDENPRACSLM